jgi:PAS domain S-box-containing protein
MGEWDPETVDEFRALTEHSMDLVSVLDESGTIIYQSPSAEQILGEGPKTRVGTNAFEYVHPDDRKHIMEKFMEMIQSPETVTERVEYRFEHGDGSWIWIESIGSNRTDTAISGYVINSRDISERKEKEQRLAQQNEQLDQFANIISHELRNPLNVAELRLELAREECNSEHLDDVARAHERMNTLIDDLLTLAREGEQVGEMESVDLENLAVNCWQNVATDDATLTTDVERPIQADPSRLQQLLENLTRNAVEHGGEDMTVTIGALDDGFYVEDDASGIPETERDTVFEAGYSTSDEGTGFGLAIVKQIADAHGWEIRVTDGSDGGARLEITGVEFAV